MAGYDNVGDWEHDDCGIIKQFINYTKYEKWLISCWCQEKLKNE